jgi:hypothetical protein
MDPDTLRAALERFASDLSIAGEPATFDVVVARHLPLFLSARETGLKAPRLASLLAQCGARRADGSAITADQIRASVSRARRRTAQALSNAEAADALAPAPTPSRSVVSRERVRSVPAPVAAATSRAPQSSRRSASPIGPVDQDVSEADLQAARSRLLKT